MTLLSLVAKGGWIMIFIGLASIAGAWAYLERLLSFNALKINVEGLTKQIRGYVEQGRVSEGIQRFEKLPAPAAKVAVAGLRASGKDREVIREAIETEANRQVRILESRTTVLATVAAIAPLMGFLGTVTGMITAFHQIESLQGNVDASVLAGGIKEALVTTAAGLIVGIPAIVAYNHITTRIQKMVGEMEDVGGELVVMLS